MRRWLLRGVVGNWVAMAAAFGYAQSGGGTTPVAVKVDAVGAPAVRTPVAEPGYRLAPEDILEISVWREDGLKKEVVVRPDGFISFPLAGELLAAGRTTDELKTELVGRLSKLIAEPEVSIAVLRVGGNKIYVIGRVNKPGEFAAGRYIDVLQALSMAGGLTPFAAENEIKIVRKDNGKDTFLPFRYSDVRKGRNLEQNITLRSGDVIVVP